MSGLPRTERPDAPAYLQRHQQREAARAAAPAARTDQDRTDQDRTDQDRTDQDRDGNVPLYLRRFRDRDGASGRAASDLSYAGESLGTSWAWAEVTRTKEIVPERRDQLATVSADIYLIRHGETQGYSSESGLTPLGAWQAHRRGQELARRVLTGMNAEIVCAPTNRARQTAEHVRRGLLDNLELFERTAVVSEIRDNPDFRNFEVATPEGPRDVTSAFRIYHREMEKYERIGLGERPGWLVDVDRFWGIQQGGGDPITHWLTMPMLHFEPPVTCIRRFWRGILNLAENSQSTAGANQIFVATHSGPIRAFATAAMGYDPGEPFNTEFVRVRLIEGGTTALVLYRNRVQEVAIPDLEAPEYWAAPPTSDPRFQEVS